MILYRKITDSLIAVLFIEALLIAPTKTSTPIIIHSMIHRDNLLHPLIIIRSMAIALSATITQPSFALKIT
jgi:hypothetical protein